MLWVWDELRYCVHEYAISNKRHHHEHKLRDGNGHRHWCNRLNTDRYRESDHHNIRRLRREALCFDGIPMSRVHGPRLLQQ